MIPVTDLRNGTNFELDHELWKVLEYKHIKVGRGNATIRVKVKNIKTGATTEKTFTSGDKVQEAYITTYPAQYLYRDGESYIFMDTATFEQFSISKEMLGIGVNFLQDNMKIDVQMYENNPIGIELPSSVALSVTHTEPAVKGNTTGNVTKPATVATGYVLQVPAFITIGDTIKINTETGEYISRV